MPVAAVVDSTVVAVGGLEGEGAASGTGAGRSEVPAAAIWPMNPGTGEAAPLLCAGLGEVGREDRVEDAAATAAEGDLLVANVAAGETTRTRMRGLSSSAAIISAPLSTLDVAFSFRPACNSLSSVSLESGVPSIGFNRSVRCRGEPESSAATENAGGDLDG